MRSLAWQERGRGAARKDDARQTIQGVSPQVVLRCLQKRLTHSCVTFVRQKPAKRQVVHEAESSAPQCGVQPAHIITCMDTMEAIDGIMPADGVASHQLNSSEGEQPLGNESGTASMQCCGSYSRRSLAAVSSLSLCLPARPPSLCSTQACTGGTAAAAGHRARRFIRLGGGQNTQRQQHAHLPTQRTNVSSRSSTSVPRSYCPRSATLRVR